MGDVPEIDITDEPELDIEEEPSAHSITAWGQLATADIPTSLSIPRSASQSNSEFILQQTAGIQELAAAIIQHASGVRLSPGLITQPAKMIENRRLQAKQKAKTGRILSQNEAIQAERSRRVITCSACHQQGHHRASWKCPIKSGRVPESIISSIHGPILTPVWEGRGMDSLQLSTGKLTRKAPFLIASIY